MNEHDQFARHLDELGATAVAGTTAPPFDPHATRRARAGRHPRRWLSVAVVAALIAGAGGTYAALGSDPQRRVETTPADVPEELVECDRLRATPLDLAFALDPTIIDHESTMFSGGGSRSEGLDGRLEFTSEDLTAVVSVEEVPAGTSAMPSFPDGEVRVCDPAPGSSEVLEVPARWSEGDGSVEAVFELSDGSAVWRTSVSITESGGDTATLRADAVRIIEAIRWRDPTAGGPSGPEVPPADWRPVDHEGMRLFVPPSWEVVEGGCHGQDRTLTVGAPPQRVQCPEPDPSAQWMWIAPAAAVADRSTGCVAGSHNHVPGCLAQNLDAGEQILFADGASVALVSQRGDGDDVEVSEISATWRYQDQDRPEAQPGHLQEQPLSVGQQFALAFSAGRCADAAAMAAPGVDLGCVPSDPPLEVTPRESWLPAGGAIPTHWVRVITDPGPRTFHVELQLSWSPEHHRGTWQVIRVIEER